MGTRVVNMRPELDMYPLWEKIGEIIFLCKASPSCNDVPDPYYIQVDGKWVKSPAAVAWAPQAPSHPISPGEYTRYHNDPGWIARLSQYYLFKSLPSRVY